MSKAFDEWWDNTGWSYGDYNKMQKVWNAALLHAAEIAERLAKEIDAVHGDPMYIAAAIRKEIE